MSYLGHSGAYVGQWEGLAGEVGFEKALELLGGNATGSSVFS